MRPTPYYRLLGGFSLKEQVSPGGSLPPFRGQGLLAVLLLSPNKRLSRRALARELYPDLDEAAGRARLSDHLHLIKKADPLFEVSIDEQVLGWTGRGRTTDVQLLRATLGPGGDADVEATERALSWYQGHLLPEFDLSTINAERAACRQTAELGLARLTRFLEAEGRLSEALTWAERWLDLFPTEERPMSAVLSLCRAQGFAQRGWDAFQRFERRLERELGARPSAEARRLALEVRQGQVPRKAGPTVTLTETVLLDRALFLQDRQSVEERFDSAQTRWGTHPAWRLRELSHVDFAGDRRALLEAANAQLSWSTSQSLPDGLFRRFQAVCLVFLARAQSEVDSTSEALRSLERAAGLLERVSVLGSNGSDELWDSPFVSTEFLQAAIGLQRMAVQDKSGNGRATLEEGARLRVRLEGSATDPRRIWSECLLLRLEVLMGGTLSHMGKVHDSIAVLVGAREQALALRATAYVDICDLILSGCYDTLGRWDASGPILRDLVTRRREAGDTFRLGQTLYNLAAHLGSRPSTDLASAHRFAEEASSLFQAVNSDGWRASTLTTMGYISWQQGEHQRALGEYTQALELHTKLGEELFVTEIHGYRALALVGLGRVEEALVESERGINASLIGSETAVACDAWIARFLCLEAAQRGEEARAILIRAADHAFGEAAELLDAESCSAFLQRDPLMRQLQQSLAQAGLLESYRGRLPFSSASPTPVRSSLALRRVKLLAAWKDFQSRNVRPTVGRLARVLGVSVRSVERDLAALRKDGSLT